MKVFSGHASPGERTSTTTRVLKVMSIFTGVESFSILCAIVRMKLIAIWLDATGIGLLNIFNSTIETTSYLSGLGIRQSGVRDLAKGFKDGPSMFRRAITTVRSWSVVAAMLGGVGLTAMSIPLAKIIFNDGAMWWNFAVLGGAVLLNALNSGEVAIFQASEEFRRLAKAGLAGSFAGVLISVPLYYYLGTTSVSLSLLALSLSTLAAALWMRNRKFDNCRPRRSHLKGGMEMIRLGAWISLASFFSTLCQLIFMTWLNRHASIAEVGLYGAGVTLVVRYTGLVFNSVSLEFYPRIAGNIRHGNRIQIFVNHEINLLLLIFTPMLLLFLIFREWIVLLLYSRDFLQIIPFITWGIVVVLLRAVSNTMAMYILARGEGKIYIMTEATDTLLGLGLSILFYEMLGLLGLGIALVVWHTAYMLVIVCLCGWRYGLTLTGRTAGNAFLSLFTAGCAIWTIYFLPFPAAAAAMGTAAIIYSGFFLRYFFRRRRSRTPVSQDLQ